MQYLGAWADKEFYSALQALRRREHPTEQRLVGTPHGAQCATHTRLTLHVRDK